VIAIIGGGRSSLRIEVLQEVTPGSLSVVADLGRVGGYQRRADRGSTTTVAGQNVYVFFESAGIQEVDVSNPTHPAVVGWLRAPFTNICGAQGSGSVLYLSGCDGIMVAQTSPAQ
jgi:hypothetical protein